MAAVTDPDVLARFKASQTPEGQTLALFDPQGNAPTKPFGADAMQPPAEAPAAASAPAPQRKAVTDPAVLARFKATSAKKPEPELPTIMGSKVPAEILAAIGDNPVSTGIHEGLTNRGIGVIQTGYDVMKSLGIIDHNPEFEAAIQKAHAKEEAAAKGSGVGGAVGEIIGDPINWIGGGGAAAGRTAAKTAGVAAMRDAAARELGKEGIKAAGRKAVTKEFAKAGAKAGAKIGATSGALAVTPDDSIATRLKGTAKSAAVGAVTGAAIPYAAAGIGNTVRGANTAATDIMAAGKTGTGRTPEQLDEALKALADEGDGFFTAMRQNNVAFTPRDRADLAQRAQDAFTTDRLTTRHPETTKAMQDLLDQLQNGVPDAVTGKRSPFDIVAFDTLRRHLGDAVGEDGAMAGKLRAALFDGLRNSEAVRANPAAADNLEMALQQWQKKSRFEDVANLAKKANNDPNRIRNAVNTFTDKSKNTQGLIPDELEALTRAGQRNLGEKIMSLAGRFGIDMGSISRNPNVIVPTLMATAKSGVQAGGGYVFGGPVPVAIGTVANSLRNRIANGKVEKALQMIEERPINAPARPAVPPAAPVIPQLAGPAAPLALPAPPTIMVPGGPGGALRPADEIERAAMYAQHGKTPELEVPPAGAPRAPSTVQQQANDSVRTQYQDMSLTPDVLNAQRGRQVTAAEAQKAVQDAAAQQARAAQLHASQPQPTIGDMLQQSQAASADRAAAVGEAPPQLSTMGQALAKAVQDAQGGAPAAPGPLKITVRPHSPWYVPDDQLPQVDLPKVNQ